MTLPIIEKAHAMSQLFVKWIDRGAYAEQCINILQKNHIMLCLEFISLLNHKNNQISMLNFIC